MKDLKTNDLMAVSAGKTPPYTKHVITGSNGITVVIYDYAAGSGWASDVYVYGPNGQTNFFEGAAD